MKKILLFVFILSTNWCAAQIFVNQKNLNQTNYQYIEVWDKYNKASGKFQVMVDYGQDIASDKKGTRLRMHNSQGGLMEFNSVIAILNFMHLNGWELTATKTTEDIESYILRRRSNFSIPKVEEKTTTPSSTSADTQ